jgi:hypothetical protein
MAFDWPTNQVATWARLLTASFSRKCSRWPSTVRSEMNSRSAIWRLVRPSATSAATSLSRGLSAGVRGWLGGIGDGDAIIAGQIQLELRAWPAELQAGGWRLTKAHDQQLRPLMTGRTQLR